MNAVDRVASQVLTTDRQENPNCHHLDGVKSLWARSCSGILDCYQEGTSLHWSSSDPPHPAFSLAALPRYVFLGGGEQEVSAIAEDMAALAVKEWWCSFPTAL